MRKKPLLIIAPSARALATIARHRWRPWVIDQYGDLDTYGVAERVLCISPDCAGRFPRDALLRGVSQYVEFAAPEKLACVVGGGFETDPDLLQRVGEQVSVLGSSAQVFCSIKQQLSQILTALSESSGLRVPRTLTGAPAGPGLWLLKEAGAAGGAHVRWASSAAQAGPDTYWQEFIPGASCSALFLADRARCVLCGVAKHLRSAVSRRAPFRYEGAVVLPTCPPDLRPQLEALGVSVSRHLGVKGLFGVDFVLTAAGECVPVDINPRIVATLELYADSEKLLEQHFAACSGASLLYSAPDKQPSRVHQVVYARAAWAVPAGLNWPACVTDRPPPNTRIQADDALCSLHAVGDNPDAALCALRGAARALSDSLARHGAHVVVGQNAATYRGDEANVGIKSG